MYVYGIPSDEVARIVAAVSADKYGGNVRTDNMRPSGRATAFVLRVADSRGPGARTAASGRHLIAATWQAHYDVMLALFDAGASRIRSAMADYRGAPHYSTVRSLGYDLSDRGRMVRQGLYPTGRDAFLATADRTYDINAGSVMAPAAFGDL